MIHFTPDDDLLLRASEDVEARERLATRVLPSVGRLVDRYARQYDAASTRDELMRVAMRPFQRAFSAFIRDPKNLDQDVAYFAQYYVWWARQELVAYLERNHRGPDGA